MMQLQSKRSTVHENQIMNNNNKAALFEQYHQALLVEFTNNIRENINIRLDAVEQIVNLGLPDTFDRFVINTDARDSIMAKIKPEIDDKTKVQHKACTKQINSIKDYKNVARNRLNRNKPKFLGNFVFGEIIFHRLYPHIYQQCTLHQLPSTSIMRYFISILITIFENHAQFTQTKPQPIITYNTLVNQNLFLSGCLNLLKMYQIPANLYETEKRKPSRKNKTATKKSKEPAKRDKAKMAYQRIVDAMKLINTEEKLCSVPVPQCIITGHDTRKNKTYQTSCITPPSFPEPEDIYGLGQAQYISANTNIPVLPQISQIPQVPQVQSLAQLPPIPNVPSFGSCTNMQYTHFVQDAHSNSSSSGDELSASTNSANSGDRDTQNVSPDDGGMSREYSSSSAANSLSMHIPEHIDNVVYNANNFGLDQRRNGYNNYNQHQHQQCQQNEYPQLSALPALPASNDNIWNLNQNMDINEYQTPPPLQPRQQSQDMFYGNNNNQNIAFNDEYKQNVMTQSGYNNNNNMNMNINNNYNYNTVNSNLNFSNNNGNMNENNIDVNRDKNFGAMISGANFNNNVVNSNNYDISLSQPRQTSFQYPQQTQQPQPAPFISNKTQIQPPMVQQYDHQRSFTVNRNNDNLNMFMENGTMHNNNTATIASTNNQQLFGFDNNSIANSNVNTNAFGWIDNNSVSMNNMNNMNNINMNNLSQNHSVQMPTIVGDNSPNTISGYGPSRGRSISNNVSSLRYSPLTLPAPRTQPVTISCNPFSCTSTSNNSGDAVQSNNNYMVPFPFGGHQNNNNNNYGY